MASALPSIVVVLTLRKAWRGYCTCFSQLHVHRPLHHYNEQHYLHQQDNTALCGDIWMESRARCVCVYMSDRVFDQSRWMSAYLSLCVSLRAPRL